MNQFDLLFTVLIFDLLIALIVFCCLCARDLDQNDRE